MKGGTPGVSSSPLASALSGHQANAWHELRNEFRPVERVVEIHARDLHMFFTQGLGPRPLATLDGLNNCMVLAVGLLHPLLPFFHGRLHGQHRAG